MAARPLTLRGWATPLTIGAFILMAGTGVVMFFKLDNGLMAPIHRLFSWVFLLGAINHIAANIRPFANHLKSAIGRTSVVVFAAVLLGSFYSWGQVTSPKLIKPIETATLGSSLGTLAQMQHIAPDVLISRLQQHGVMARTDQSVRDIAVANQVKEDRLLAIIFHID